MEHEHVGLAAEHGHRREILDRIVSCWPIFWARMRAMMSVLAPAGNGTIKRMGRCGHSASLDWAVVAQPRTTTAASAIDMNRSICATPLCAHRGGLRVSSSA
jgi:hypothetical protein